MSLTIQTITVTGNSNQAIVATLPAEHIYPFIIHRSISEYLEKQSGERTRYTKKHIVTHLLTGACVGVFPNYDNALIFARKLKDKPMFLMPSIELMNKHPDYKAIAKQVSALKLRYALDD